jgi:hypothetical protein
MRRPGVLAGGQGFPADRRRLEVREMLDAGEPGRRGRLAGRRGGGKGVDVQEDEENEQKTGVFHHLHIPGSDPRLLFLRWFPLCGLPPRMGIARTPAKRT